MGRPLTETARLIGERPSLDRLDEFAAMMASPLVAETMWPGDLGGPRTREQSEEWIRRDLAQWDADGFGAWHAIERATGELVGRIGARRTSVEGAGEVELAWVVRADRWGRGYAAELADAARSESFARGTPSIVAFTLPSNSSSRRVMEKLGMAYERDIVHVGLPHVLYRSFPA